MRAFPLGSFQAGITRLRDKGGASASSLYDLLNGYIDASGAPTSRFGTTLNHTLPAGTKGLCMFQGKKHVFAMTAIDPGSAEYVVDILVHPDPSFTGTLSKIHFAKPFLGYLYVVAEFSDGQVFHYWLQAKDAWQASTVYKNSDTVRPTVVNGFVYKPTSASNPSAWSAATNYAVGDVVQPTTYDGYQYTVIEVSGTPAVSGDTEPTWIASNGALIYDDSTGTTTPAAPALPSAGSPAGTRYDNLIGAKTYKSGVSNA